MQGAVDDDESSKKPRRSERLSQSQTTTGTSNNLQKPSPIAEESLTPPAKGYKETTATPPKYKDQPSQAYLSSITDGAALSSPPQDTQAFSQYPSAPSAFGEVENEAEEGVWGYLIPLDQKYGKSLVLNKKNTCPEEAEGKDGKTEQTPRTKARAAAAGGYLIGRHPECGKFDWIPLIGR